MFFISALSVGLMKTEFMSIWEREPNHLLLECFMEDWMPVATLES